MVSPSSWRRIFCVHFVLGGSVRICLFCSHSFQETIKKDLGYIHRPRYFKAPIRLKIYIPFVLQTRCLLRHFISIRCECKVLFCMKVTALFELLFLNTTHILLYLFSMLWVILSHTISLLLKKLV